MAKVYSWEVSKNPRKYSYIIHPYDTEKTENPETGEPRAYVGSELEGENLENVKNWTINCTDEEYETQFNKMVQLCKDKDYTVEFESVGSYLDVTESCDNLRGPEGRGIDKITTDYSGTEYTIYTVHYTDGTTYSFTVHNGKDGKNGEDGKNGNPGDSGVSSRQVTIYITSEEKPDTPVGGNYDFVNYKLTCPEGWYPNCDELKAPIWMSSRTFATSTASTDNNWTEAIKITGDSGKPGVDGITTEFIYCRQDTEPDTPKPNENAQDANGKFPNQSGYVPTGWTGSPQGIDENNKTEWCSTRNKTVDEHGTSTWGAWGNPFRWARWGVDGKDGDGVQYIYLLAEEKYTPVNPTPDDWKTNKLYQNPSGEWIPDEIKDNNKEVEDGKYTNNWYDSPLTVTMNYPHLWVSVRKYTYGDEGKEKMWGEYSNPSLFAKFGQDGKSATYIRKIYITTSGTDDVPQVPQGSNSASDIDVWSLSFPSDYENGENVVWATEAEASAADNKFVYHYKRISTTTDEGEKLPEDYKDKENLFFKHAGKSVPDEKVHNEDTHEGIIVDGKYYLWSGGWCAPYLVTGVKGDSADPINYTTYVFAYGYSDSTPGVPTGNSIENLGASQDGFGRPIYWEDAPTVEKTIEVTNDTIYREEGKKEIYIDIHGNETSVIRRWYQCVGYVNSKDNNSVKWGAVVPLYAKDGEAGKDGSYVEYRFYVTKDEKKPEVVSRDKQGKPIRVPYTKEGNQQKQWLTINDAGFNSDIPSGGAMWQMWTYITKTTSKPEEPTTNPDGNGEGGGDNTSGGNTDINGGETENGNLNTDLGDKDDITTVETGDTTVETGDTNDTGTDGEGSEGGEGSDGPSLDDAVESISEWYGPIRISGEKGETGERGPAGLRGVTGIPGANYIQMYCLGTTSKEVKPYDFESIETNPSIKFSDGYFGGIYKDEEETAIPPEKLKDWYDSKNIPNSTIIECDSNDDLESVKISRNIGRVCVYIENKGTDNEKHIYYLITGDQKGDDKTTPAIDIKPLTKPLSKEESENFNVYTWCLQGIESWTEGEHEWYVKLEELPEDSDDTNTYEGTQLPSGKDQKYKYFIIEQTKEEEGETVTTYEYYEWQEIDGDEVQHKPSITWGPPFKLQGADGLKGKDGTRGQMIYPMGVYSQNEVYITTTEKAPYVFDPSDGMFYVYNVVGEDKAWVGTLPDKYDEVIVHPQDAKESNTNPDTPTTNPENITTEDKNYKYLKYNGNYYAWDDTTGSYKMASKYKYSIDGSGKPNTWYPDQGGATPSSNYNEFTEANQTPAWVRFESFQAFYTSLGIIENGLIGSAVYNNEFMYSQYGIKSDGTPTSYAEVASSDMTSGFLSDYEYDENKKQWKYRGTEDYIDKYDVNPYEKIKDVDENGKEVEVYRHSFMPNVCINFLTGQMWLSTGKVKFSKDEIELIVGDGNDVSGFVTEGDIAELFAKDGKIEATISAYINNKDNTSNIQISADNIFIDADNNFSLNNVITTETNNGTTTVKLQNINYLSANNANLYKSYIKNSIIYDSLVRGNFSSPFSDESSRTDIPNVEDKFNEEHEGLKGKVFDDNDNIILWTYEDDKYTYKEGKLTLRSDSSQSGRRRVIINDSLYYNPGGYKTCPYDKVVIDSIGGLDKFEFYENGIAKPILELKAHEYVEVLGYCSPYGENNFLGWIVLNRGFVPYNNNRSPYAGANLKVYALGRIGVTSSGTLSTEKTFMSTFNGAVPEIEILINTDDTIRKFVNVTIEGWDDILKESSIFVCNFAGGISGAQMYTSTVNGSKITFKSIIDGSGAKAESLFEFLIVGRSNLITYDNYTKKENGNSYLDGPSR